MEEGEQKRLVVLYGSQTGTCEDVAHRIAMQSRGSPFRCVCKPVDEYDLQELINEELVVFVVSTTGQGEPPDNMMKFWKFIMRKQLPASSLSELQFGVLGLGDSSYTKFNFVAKKLYRRLQSLGAEAVFELGLADDQHEWGAESVVDSWIVNMWTGLLQMWPSSPSSQFKNPLTLTDIKPRFEVRKSDGDELKEEEENEKRQQHGPFNASNPLRARVIENTRVTSPDHFQDTRLIKLDVSGHEAEVTYLPGDVAMVQPRNLDDDVQELVDVLSFDCDVPMLFTSVTSDDPAPSFPRPISVRQLAKRYLDFKALPGRTFFQIMASLSRDGQEREKLSELGSLEGTEERYDYVNRPRRTILEVLTDFHLTASLIKPENLLDVIPFIRARAFSIASSPTRHRGQIHLLVAVVDYKTRLMRRRRGLCSTYLSSLLPSRDHHVSLWVKRGGIRFDLDRPNIMVGPGTGVAPFRSAAHELHARGTTDSVLFFGCRSSAKDFYFAEEWKELEGCNSLRLFTAFSRDQRDKVYVQHRILQQGELLWQLIHRRNAFVYVAGNSKQMPDAVREAFVEVFKRHGGLSEEEATRLHLDMQNNKRYQQETWS